MTGELVRMFDYHMHAHLLDDRGEGMRDVEISILEAGKLLESDGTFRGGGLQVDFLSEDETRGKRRRGRE